MHTPPQTYHRASQLRREMTLPEVVLWERLRRGGLADLKFRRQHPIGPYVLDFYCASARLCVEVDGLAHDSVQQAERDQRRTSWLERQNIRVLRVVAADILRDSSLSGVLEAILEAARPSTAVPAVPLPSKAGEEPD